MKSLDEQPTQGANVGPPLTSGLLRLHPDDNVAIACRKFDLGECVELSGHTVRLPHALCLGAKVALEPIAAGAKILKYGVRIGSATRAIARGEIVHVENAESDYIPACSERRRARLSSAS